MLCILSSEYGHGSSIIQYHTGIDVSHDGLCLSLVHITTCLSCLVVAFSICYLQYVHFIMFMFWFAKRINHYGQRTWVWCYMV